MKIKAFTVGIAEMAMSIGAVLLFFLMFMAILGLSFPQGTGLRDLLSLEDSPELDGHGGLDLSLGDGAVGTIGFVARLSDVSRRVKDKRANAISWQDARRGIALENRHAVQTFGRSGAKISFDEANSLDLGENSLVIIRKLEQTADFAEKRASLVILDGELRGSVAESGEETMELEIVTASTVSKIRSTQAVKSDFKIVTHDDDSSSIAVFSGTAEVTAGDKTVRVPAHHVLNVDNQGLFKAPIRIPSKPALKSPVTRSEYTYRSVPPQVRLEWETVKSADAYRVQIAQDARFKSLVLQAETGDTWLVHGNLESGRYYWRVSAQNQSIGGLAATPRIFDITRDDDPPSLNLQMPGRVLNAGSFRLKGTTEPDAQVFIGDLTIPISQTGEFEYDLSLEPGLNVLVVEAFDPAGNVTYVSQLVHAQF